MKNAGKESLEISPRKDIQQVVSFKGNPGFIPHFLLSTSKSFLRLFCSITRRLTSWLESGIVWDWGSDPCRNWARYMVAFWAKERRAKFNNQSKRLPVKGRTIRHLRVSRVVVKTLVTNEF